MPFGYPKEIFPHPAVQYIPINFHTINLIKNWQPSFLQNKVKLHILANSNQAQKFINNYQLPNTEIDQLKENELLIIVFNAEVKDIKYRAFKVTMIGHTIDNSAHIFKIKTKYFYKQDLYFNLYTPTGEKLSTETFTLPSKSF